MNTTNAMATRCREAQARGAIRVRQAHEAHFACATWEAYTIPARTPEGRPTTMAGHGCRDHHIFISD